MSEEHILVMSCVSNVDRRTGGGGYGVYGYTLKTSKRPNSIKHPAVNKYNFTTTGLVALKDSLPYETKEVIECVASVVGVHDNGALADVLALSRVMGLALELEALTSVRILVDVEGMATGFSDYVINGLAPKRYADQWHKVAQQLTALRDKFPELSVTVRYCDTKSPEINYGLQIADFYSLVGANASHADPSALEAPFTPDLDTVLLQKTSSYKEYKASFETKDIALFFKNVHFSTQLQDDDQHCYLSASEDSADIGKRVRTNTYAFVKGEIPDYIRDARALFRALPRNHIGSGYIDLRHLSDKIKLRLAKLIGIQRLLYPKTRMGNVEYHMLCEEDAFMAECTREFPYIVEAGAIFHGLRDLSEKAAFGAEHCVIDIADQIVQEGKLLVKNTDSSLQLTDRIHIDSITPLSKVYIEFDVDAPSYLALKSVEGEIVSARAIVESQPQSNYLTLYVVITLQDREIYTTNLPFKFLSVRAN